MSVVNIYSHKSKSQIVIRVRNYGLRSLGSELLGHFPIVFWSLWRMRERDVLGFLLQTVSAQVSAGQRRAYLRRADRRFEFFRLGRFFKLRVLDDFTLFDDLGRGLRRVFRSVHGVLTAAGARSGELGRWTRFGDRGLLECGSVRGLGNRMNRLNLRNGRRFD